MKKNFSQDFLKLLSINMKEQSFSPNEKIFSQGDFDKNFYFVMKGKVELNINLGVKEQILVEIKHVNINKII